VTAVRHVGFNALFLEPGASGGADTYVRGLVPAFARLCPGVRLTVFTNGRAAASLRRAGWGQFADLVALVPGRIRRGSRLVGELILAPRAASRAHCDVLHSLANTGPLHVQGASVLTVLDVIYMTTKTLNPVTTLALRQLVPRVARRADALIAISESARDEVARVLGIPRDAMTVVPLGISPPASSAPVEAVRDRYGLGGRRVILCVAALRPHKNQALLLRALHGLPDDTVLVLVGHPERSSAALHADARRLAADRRVRILGYVADDELEALWHLATCAALPTLAEGFGLPLAEAMSRGVPVACSDLSVLREVGGDVPHYFDPNDPDDAARAIQSAMDDANASARGPKRAARFTWEETARRTLLVYESALAARS
jgi:glycosyltransferase involved in cell wall biosynthesis